MNIHFCDKIDIHRKDFPSATQISGEDIDIFLKHYNYGNSFLGIIVLVISIFFIFINFINTFIDGLSGSTGITIYHVIVYIIILVVSIVVFKKTRKIKSEDIDKVLIDGVYSVNVKFKNVEKLEDDDEVISYYGYIEKEDGTLLDKKFIISSYNYNYGSGKLFFYKNKKEEEIMIIDDTLERKG